MQSFDEESRKSRAMILITDGEEHSGAYLEAAREAAKEGIRIYTLGMGSSDGHPIPDPENQGRNLKDAQGGIVISRLNETILQEIALETQGVYVRAQTSDDDLKQIYLDEILTRVQSRRLKSTRQKRFESRFQIFLAIAVLLLVLESFLRRTPWKAAGASRALPLLLMGFLAVGQPAARELKEWFGFPSSAEAQVLDGRKSYLEGDYASAVSKFGEAEIDLPENPENIYNLGNSYYQHGDYSRAKEHYGRVLAQSLKPHNLAQDARYNLGNAQVHLGDLEGAIKTYEEVLKEDPEHESAKANLEWARRKLKELLNKQKKSENSSQKNQKNQQGQKNQKDQSQKGESGQKNQKNQEKSDQQHGSQKENKPQPSPGEKQKQENKKQSDQKGAEKSKQKEKEKVPDESKENEASKSGKEQSPGSESKEVRRLNKEEAQRFLNRLSRENKDQLKRFIRYKLQGKGRGRGKKW